MNDAPRKNDVALQESHLDATLAALNQVQAPARLAHRVHARLAQQPIAAAQRPSVSGMLPWAALASVAAGLVAALVLHPPVHSGAPALQPTGTPAAVSAPAIAGAPSSQPDAVHPGFLPQQRKSGAALNTHGTVMTAKARAEHQAEEAQAAKTGTAKRPVREARNHPLAALTQPASR